jgi:hypothetical protein
MATYNSQVGIRLMGGISSTAFDTDALMQEYALTGQADKIEIRNSSGEVKARYDYNPTRKAKFTYYVGDSVITTSSSIVYPTPGTKITVTETLTGGAATGSAWITDDYTITGTNQDGTKVEVNTTEYTGNIT